MRHTSYYSSIPSIWLRLVCLNVDNTLRRRRRYEISPAGSSLHLCPGPCLRRWFCSTAYQDRTQIRFLGNSMPLGMPGALPSHHQLRKLLESTVPAVTKLFFQWSPLDVRRRCPRQFFYSLSIPQRWCFTRGYGPNAQGMHSFISVVVKTTWQ